MPFVVTGATGLLGNNVVRLLLHGGASVRAIVRRGSNVRALADLPVEVVHAPLAADAAAVETLRRAVTGAHAVIHCAGRVQFGRRDLAGFQEANVEATRAVAAACRQADVRMMHVSSVDTLRWGTRDDPGDETLSAAPEIDAPYVITKREADLVIADEIHRGLDAVTLHPAYILGAWDWKPSSGRMLLEVARQPLVFAPPGGNDFCHAEDVAQGILSAIDRAPPGAHYVLGGEALSYGEAFRLFARVVGRSGPVIDAPALLTRIAGRAGDIAGSILGRELDVNSRAAAASVRSHHFTSARAQRELGYRSRSAEQAATDAWQWFRAHGYA